MNESEPETRTTNPATSTPATEPAPDPAWRDVWQRGIAQVASVRELEALRDGLRANDRRLYHGTTTMPLAVGDDEVTNWPVEHACALGYCGWQAHGYVTIGQVENYVADLFCAVDVRMGRTQEQAARILPFVWWWDSGYPDETTTPEERRQLLLAEVEASLAAKTAEAPAF